MESRTFLQAGKGSAAPPAPPTSVYASLAAPSPACFPLLYGNYPFLSAAAAPFLPIHPCLLPPLPRSKQHFHPLGPFGDSKLPSPPPPTSNFQLPQLTPEKSTSPKEKSACRLCDWLTNHDRSGKIYSGIYRDEELMPGSRRTKLRGVLQASCCLKRSDCCLPPTPVYFLEDSRRFYELLSPVLLLLSLTALQLVSV
ncbi:hypothetical protein LAZ67_6001483 [Cordylochernes scorpioides]|uniref:Uncharacterized protein n=1 Tax=Cordylochernes scorpioides TaxID=51811 RepID=A0ABY6KJV1_9ARAC|nr:hypothetical protein LAZ67_6001483 [Cordylochernes scorpioides]